MFSGEFGYLSYVHSLVAYEKIYPSLIENSKKFRKMNIVSPFPKNIEEESYFYVPVIICITTSSSFIDIFHEILQVLYLQLKKSKESSDKNRIFSLEFIKQLFFLTENVIIPP